MPPQNTPQSDTKLLLAVAGLVVVGAVGVALVAGLTVQRDDSSASAVSERATSTSRLPTVAERDRVRAMPTSLETMSGSSIEIEPASTAASLEAVAEVPPVNFEIDPQLDPWREGSRAYHERDFVRAAAYFRADTEARPERAYSHYMLALALWKSDERERALEAMERSAELNDQSIRTFINLARIQHSRGDHEGARTAAERALVIDAENPAALYQLARAHYNLGAIDAAVATLESCITLDQSAAEAHNLLGLVRLQGGDDSAALRSLEVAASLKPDVAHIQNNLGTALERTGRLEEAAIAFARAVEIDGDHRAAAVSLARVGGPRAPEETDEVPPVELAETGPVEVLATTADAAPPASDNDTIDETESADDGDPSIEGESSD